MLIIIIIIMIVTLSLHIVPLLQKKIWGHIARLLMFSKPFVCFGLIRKLKLSFSLDMCREVQHMKILVPGSQAANSVIPNPTASFIFIQHQVTQATGGQLPGLLQHSKRKNLRVERAQENSCLRVALNLRKSNKHTLS